jgi:signal recognition particle GTPase
VAATVQPDEIVFVMDSSMGQSVADQVSAQAWTTMGCAAFSVLCAAVF